MPSLNTHIDLAEQYRPEGIGDMIYPRLVGIAVIVVCGLGTITPPLPTAAQTGQAPQGPEPALVLTRKATPLGEILADRDGRTLYVFTDDEPGGPGPLPTLSCLEDCADDWP